MFALQSQTTERFQYGNTYENEFLNALNLYNLKFKKVPVSVGCNKQKANLLLQENFDAPARIVHR